MTLLETDLNFYSEEQIYELINSKKILSFIEDCLRQGGKLDEPSIKLLLKLMSSHEIALQINNSKDLICLMIKLLAKKKSELMLDALEALINLILFTVSRDGDIKNQINDG